MNKNGLKQIILGDLNTNTRHRQWDKRANERGVAVCNIVTEFDRMYTAAAPISSYYKVIKKYKKYSGTLVECSSNPDIGISRIQNTTATVEERTWRNVSDHQPVLFRVLAKLTVKSVGKRVAKALFYSQTTKQQISEQYRDTIPQITAILDSIQVDTAESGILKLYEKIERSIVEPWETVVSNRPPGKPVWWHAGIGKAHSKRAKLAR